ncbi:GNAT family N-acetyltransferase [Nocardioides sp. 503]|uniref:GNAT family N-acetyltransferase n=1 Tax=Nocardioides sp. 503 TaxID=2508326 RepID=UPI00106FDE36|nr:GNAT family N-acetyltransferase [Nocardioides sp. 503]
MPATGGISLLVVDELGPRAAEWDSLVSQQPLPSPFLRTSWLESVTDRRVRVTLLVLEEGRLLGGVALVRDRLLGVERYRFAGQGVLCPDHLDLVAAPGRERDVQATIRGWFAAPGARVLDLVGLAEGSRLAAALPGSATPVDLAPYQPLTEDDYLASRSSNFRRATRKADRRMTEDGYVHTQVAPADLPAAFGELRRLHETRDGRGPLLEQLPTLAEAFTAAVARDEARVDLLASPEEVVAVSLAFTCDARLSLYQVARSLDHEHRSAGTVLLHRVIVDAHAAGARELDMLRGDEAYKASFADHSRTVLRLRVGHGLLGRAVVAGWGAAVSGNRRFRTLRDRAAAWRRRRPS